MSHFFLHNSFAKQLHSCRYQTVEYLFLLLTPEKRFGMAESSKCPHSHLRVMTVDSWTPMGKCDVVPDRVGWDWCYKTGIFFLGENVSTRAWKFVWTHLWQIFRDDGVGQIYVPHRRYVTESVGVTPICPTERLPYIIPTNSKAPSIPTVFWLGSHLSNSKKKDHDSDKRDH